MYLINGSSDLLTIRNYIGASDVSDVSDQDIIDLVELNESEIFSESSVQFYSTTVTELYDGDNTGQLYLNHFPVESVSSLIVNGSTFTNYNVYKDINLIKLPNYIYGQLYGQVFIKGLQNVSVTYTYGCLSSEDPNYFNLARKLCFKMTEKDLLIRLSNNKSGGLVSERLDSYQFSYGPRGAYGNSILELNNDIQDLWLKVGRKVMATVF